MTADTIGGVWTYTLDLIRSLAPAHYQVTLATFGDPLSAAQWQAVADLPHLEICESTYALEWMDEPWTDVDAAGAWLLACAERCQADLIHFNNYVHAALPWSVPTLVVGHSCVFSWWRAVKGEAPPPRYQTYYQRVRAGLQAADVVVAPTQAMLTALNREYGPLHRTDVIANGRGCEGFATVTPKEEFVFSIGRLWDEAKNVRALEEVATDLAWPVRVAGSTDHPAGTRLALRQTKALGVLTPDAVAGMMAKAGIYALPARYEPFGLSVLEAALSGCALVLGDIPSLRENWQGAALFVQPDDHEALQNALTLLIYDERLRKRLGNEARQRAEWFTLARMGTAYDRLYQQLAGHSSYTQTQSAVAQRTVEMIHSIPHSLIDENDALL